MIAAARKMCLWSFADVSTLSASPDGSAHGDFHRFSPLSGEVTHATVVGKLVLIDG
jgi:hypothetical protein